MVDRHRVPRKHSWADAATSAQLDTIPARARAKGVSALTNISNLVGKDNPRAVTESHRGSLIPAATVTWGRLADMLVRAPSVILAGWLADLLFRIGDWMFAMNDQEAGWRGWEIERRHAGLGRRYRDPQFDTLSQCSHCGGIGVQADVRCAQCSGTGRLVLGRPPTPLERDG
jgi:hypothetical protein